MLSFLLYLQSVGGHVVVGSKVGEDKVGWMDFSWQIVLGEEISARHGSGEAGGGSISDLLD